MRALVKSCEDMGVRIIAETRARKLITSAQGKVTGVIAESKGRELKVEAKSVIIATGGVQGNTELIAKYVPDFNPDEISWWGIPHRGG